MISYPTPDCLIANYHLSFLVLYVGFDPISICEYRKILAGNWSGSGNININWKHVYISLIWSFVALICVYVLTKNCAIWEYGKWRKTSYDRYTSFSSLGMPEPGFHGFHGCQLHPQLLADQLTLFQLGGYILPTTLLKPLLLFFHHPCSLNKSCKPMYNFSTLIVDLIRSCCMEPASRDTYHSIAACCCCCCCCRCLF